MIAEVVPDQTYYDVTGLSPDTTYKYFVRAYNSAGLSADPGKEFTTTVAPPVLRIINDLYDQTSGVNEWGTMNKIVRVRIGSTETAVINNDPGTERLWPYDSASGSSDANTYVINPAYQQTGSYRDFDVSAFGSGDYSIYIQNGWWDYFAEGGGSWEKHMTTVVACDGTATTYKWATIQVTDHTGGTLEIKASDFLPTGNWYGSSFCD